MQRRKAKRTGDFALIGVLDSSFFASKRKNNNNKKDASEDQKARDIGVPSVVHALNVNVHEKPIITIQVCAR